MKKRQNNEKEARRKVEEWDEIRQDDMG